MLRLALLAVTGIIVWTQAATAQEPLPIVAAEDVALKEVHEALPEHLVYMLRLKNNSVSPGEQQLYDQSRRWEPGTTLKVCFYGGNPVVKALISGVAQEWQKYANLKIDFGKPGVWRDCESPSSGFNQIRIGFGDRGYWSVVGRQSVDILNTYQPSMNFEGFDLRFTPYQVNSAGVALKPENVIDLANVNDRGTVLHEFGHAIGFLHEHQNRALKCASEIDWPKAYAYYAGSPNFWDAAKVDRNIGPINSDIDPDARQGEPDLESIMMYAQPASIFLKGAASRCYVMRHNVLSSLDKALAAKLYPSGVSGSADVNFTTSVPASSVLMVPPPVGVFQSADRLQRITADLSSDVTSVRREARRQLALAIESGSAVSFAAIVDGLANDASKDAYRQQLGLVVAIDKAKQVPVLSVDQKNGVAESLKQIESRSKDATLSRASKDALLRLGL